MTVTSDRVLRAVVLAWLLTSATMTGVAKAGAIDAESAVAAVWHPRVVRLEYRAGGSLHMCRGLQRRVEQVMLDLGARAQVTRFYCGPLSHIVMAEMALMIPIEATEANLRRITSFDSMDVLVARLRGERLPAAADLRLFPAAWRTVSISGELSRRADCELLAHLRQQVFPSLSVRVIDDKLPHCSTVFASGAPLLVVQALVVENVDRLAESHARSRRH